MVGGDLDLIDHVNISLTLCGGHFTYGHNDSWRMPDTWKKALGAPGAVQMGILRQIFLGREQWWRIVPDQSILTAGGNIKGDVLNLAARHEDGKDPPRTSGVEQEVARAPAGCHEGSRVVVIS